MTVQEPKYKESISPNLISGVDLLDKDTLMRTCQAVNIYMRDNTHLFHKSSENKGNDKYYNLSLGITEDNIIVQSGVETEKGIPVGWEVKLFSFTTPIESFKEELIRRIKFTAKHNRFMNQKNI